MKEEKTLWVSLESGDKVELDFSYCFNIEEISACLNDNIDFDKIYTFGFEYNRIKEVTIKEKQFKHTLCFSIEEYDGWLPYKLISKNKGKKE